jgi:hypothetical protein
MTFSLTLSTSAAPVVAATALPHEVHNVGGSDQSGHSSIPWNFFYGKQLKRQLRESHSRIKSEHSAGGVAGTRSLVDIAHDHGPIMGCRKGTEMTARAAIRDVT